MRENFTKLSIGVAFCFNMTVSFAQLPTFQWAKSPGVSNNDGSKDVSVDGSGNVFYAGFFNGSADFDPGPGTYSMTAISTGGGYVSKLDGSGNFLWAVAIPGQASSIATDASGNVFVAGQYTLTQDFDPGSGTVNLTASSSNYTDIYVTKFDASGNFVWAQSLGGIDMEIVQSLTTDASGDLLMTGSFKNTVDFDPSASSYTLASSGTDDGFLVKLTSSGGFVFADKFGSTFSGESAYDVTTDATGNIYVSGTFAGGVDFDPSAATTTLTSSGGRDVFLLKLNSTNNFVWARGFGSFGDDDGRTVTTDASGVYIGGQFAGTVDFDPGAATTTLTAIGNYDAYIAKFDAAGNFSFARNIGSTGYDFCKTIQVNSSGKIVYSGSFSGSCDFDPSASATFTLSNAGATDCFVSVLDASGNFLSAGKFGSFSSDYAEGMTLNNAGDIFLAGSFLFTVDFDPSASTYTIAGAGGTDSYVMRLGDAAAGIIENAANLSVRVFPNPASEYVIVETEDILGKETFISIYDALGREIKTEEISAASTYIMLNDFKGLYTYRITRRNEVLYTGKLICE